MTIKEEFENLAAIVINPASSYGDTKIAIDALYLLFKKVGAYEIDTILPPTAQGTFLSTGGLAVSISTAAKCLFDIARTKAFATGLLQAIKSYKKNNKPVQILYAGCGPYALLAVLVIPFLKEGEAEFTLLDIHEDSLKSATGLIKALGYEEFFADVIKADATSYTWTKNDTLDIAVAECLQNALKKETQVSVAANIASNLCIDGILIPQCIKLNAVLVHLNRRSEVRTQNATIPAQEIYHELGNLVTLNKETAIASRKDIVNPFPSNLVKLPKEFLNNSYGLEVHTIIRVFDRILLSENESSLTVPLRLASAGTLGDKTVIVFRYINDEKPGLRWTAN